MPDEKNEKDLQTLRAEVAQLEIRRLLLVELIGEAEKAVSGLNNAVTTIMLLSNKLKDVTLFPY